MKGMPCVFFTSGVAVPDQRCNSQVRELVMAIQNKNGAEGRKAWLAPEFKRLSAGAAEAGGTQNIPDGGPVGNARS